MSSSMSIARAREILESVEKAHEAELKELRNQVGSKEGEIQQLQEKLKAANEKTAEMREERAVAKRHLNNRETTLVDERAEAKLQIATLEAEKSMLAERDKEAREELTRLMHQR